MIVILSVFIVGMPFFAPNHQKNDYSKTENWLCRPGRAGDACASSNLDSTTVMSDGQLKVERWNANPNPPVDCFYAYPTVSNDDSANSDMIADAQERRMTEHQFARFASLCRVYAPLYRQVTLTALRTLMAGKPIPEADFALPYKDVSDAWNHYLEHDNRGRGVVLIGHSQGAIVLTQLVREQLDKNPEKKALLVAALLFGANVPVPSGKDAGGAFDNIPLCRSNRQTGCVVAFSAFRATDPPPANTMFGRLSGGLTAACVNPAAPGGGSAALRPYLSTNGSILTPDVAALPWITPAPKEPVSTPFVTVPGLLTGACVSDERGSYLSVTVNGDPKDPRIDDIKGDVVAAGVRLSNWGLHPIDMHLVMGDLLDLVGKQSQAWLAARQPAK
jgi:pimeloyl-ACP methyl ester carboxylesterase